MLRRDPIVEEIRKIRKKTARRFKTMKAYYQYLLTFDVQQAMKRPARPTRRSRKSIASTIAAARR